MEFFHKSVLLNECIENLNIVQGGIYVDATMGGAGHSMEIVKKLTTGKLIAIDRDSDAIKAGKKRLHDFTDKIIFVHDNFINLSEILTKLDILKIDGILMDLGVSSYQLDNEERGFSYMHSSNLDMRMNVEDSVNAADIVNTYSKEELARIIFEYGEEKWAKRIAEFICKMREEKPFTTTFELVSAIKSAVPKKARDYDIHPAKRTFQAIRIEVNGELKAIRPAIKSAIKHLNPGGTVAVITFHSLEDRIVKNIFNEESKDCICPPEFPVCMCNGNHAHLKLPKHKIILPTDEEIKNNPRSRSAKLRVAIRTGNNYE